MQPLESPRWAAATAPAAQPSRQTAPDHSVPIGSGCFDLVQYRRLLAGMLGQGHGIAALCLFLTITRDVLLDLIVQFDLPTPHDRPLRRSGGVHAWKPSDFPVLLTGWLQNWSAACIAHHLDRKRGSIWYKARRLGLPKRDRRALHWPAAETVPAAVNAPAAEAVTAAVMAPAAEAGPAEVIVPESTVPTGPGRLPAKWSVKGADRLLELTSKRQGLEVNWADNIEAFVDLGWRVWSGQRICRIAEDYGVSYRTITSQLHWLQAKARRRHDQTDDFDRARGEANAKAEGYTLSRCQTNSKFPYWKVRHKTKSNRDIRNKFYDVGMVF
jgi:hypothetical protein